MPSMNTGLSHSQIWYNDVKAFVPPNPAIFDIGSMPWHNYDGLQYNELCTFDYGDDLGFAWVENGGGGYTPYVHAIYLAAGGQSIDNTYEVALPYGYFICAMKQITKYDFNVLTQSGTNGKDFKVYKVHMSMNSYDLQASYSFTPSAKNQAISSFSGTTRCGDKILLLMTVDGGYYQYAYGFEMYNVICDLNAATFSDIQTMLSITGMIDWNYPPVGDEWYGWPASNSEYSSHGAWMATNNGDNGWQVRISIRQCSAYYTANPMFQWWLTRYDLKTFIWVGWDLADDAATRTVQASTDCTGNPIFLEQVYPLRRVTLGTCSQGAGDGYCNFPTNSFFHYSHTISDVVTDGPTHHYDVVDLADPYSPCAFNTAYDITISASGPNQTGYVLTYNGFARNPSNQFYLVNFQSHTGSILLSKTGYTIYTTIINTSTPDGYIIVWGKRTSDSHYGLLVFDSAGNWIRFLDVSSTYSDTTYSYRAIYHHGFLVIFDHAWYIPSPNINLFYNIVEFN